ncbi:MAG: type II toxin-antitoxin system RelB/DinJ family antitoxin [Candidatus Berkelbacteria bacterium]|nr:type II toxin-antitoxin system RelB/DinJ family antitoxin [Candidatus Berkelbacteria bacterium]
MKTVINIKTDQETKEEAQKIARELGLSLSSIVNAYLKQVVRGQEVYFSTTCRMTHHLENILGEAEMDIATRKNLSPAFDNADDAIAWLRGAKNESSISKKVQKRV